MKLNLGSGYRKKADSINIDNRAICEPDIVCDVSQGLPLQDDTIDEVEAIDFLEHIPIGKTMFVIEEIYRVMKAGACFKHMTPSTDGRGAWQDPTHLSFWNINSWFYYMNDTYRALYGVKAKFVGELEDMITDAQNQVIHTFGRLYALK